MTDLPDSTVHRRRRYRRTTTSKQASKQAQASRLQKVQCSNYSEKNDDFVSLIITALTFHSEKGKVTITSFSTCTSYTI